MQRGRNREACFFAEEDYLAYRYWIGEALRETECRLRRNSSLAPFRGAGLTWCGRPAAIRHRGERRGSAGAAAWIPAPAFAGVTFFRRNDEGWPE